MLSDLAVLRSDRDMRMIVNAVVSVIHHACTGMNGEGERNGYHIRYSHGRAQQSI